MKPFMDHKDFLCDDLFVYWRIQPTEELDAFWGKFILENETLRAPFNQAIEAFETIRNKQGAFPINKTSILRELKLKRRWGILRIIAASSAAILLLAVISTFFILHQKPDNSAPAISSIGEVMSNNNIQLHTGNNTLEIDNNSTLNFSGKKHSAVIQNPVTQKEIDLNNNTRTNKLIVPYGKRSTLILADGSKVHLNSGTKMEFPSRFSGKKREIIVEGEIFIEVAKQNNLPFVIHTPHSQITVYGTSFNISSFSEDLRESVVLVHGSVEVKSENSAILLKPNEMAEIENGQILCKQVEVSDYTSWINGYMQFNKIPLNELLKKIGRYYNVKFRYNPALSMSDQTCSGKLFLSDNLNDVLDAFSKMTYLQYDRTDDEIIFIRQYSNNQRD